MGDNLFQGLPPPSAPPPPRSSAEQQQSSTTSAAATAVAKESLPKPPPPPALKSALKRSKPPQPQSEDHRAITKTQQSLSVEAHVEELRAHPIRDAPTLLNYIPSYKGKLKRKKKDKEPGPSTKAKGKKSATEVGVGDQVPKPSKKVKEPRVKFPTFQKSADFWFQESQPADLQGTHIPPIRTLIPQFADDMGRRNVVRMNLKEAAAASKKVAAPSPTESPAKRQKVHDFFPARPPTPVPKEKDQSESSAAGGSKAVERAAGSDGRVIVSEFAPSFAMADGRVVTVEDSVKEEPGLAVTMLHGLALPKDMDRIPGELQPSLVHTSAYLVQAGQAVLRASRQAELLAAERTRYRDEAKAEREKAKAAKNGLRFAKSRVAELEKERDEALENAKTAERELGQVVRREKRKMKEVDEKAFQAGYDRAGAEYVREARSMVNEELAKKLPIAYRTGYKDGVRAACGVMQLEPDMNLMKSIPVADVPELVLPYTEEECAPLAPEEFPDSEDDVEDMTIADAEGGGDGSTGEKKGEADNAEQVPEPVQKNDEVVVEAEDDAAGQTEAAAEGDPPQP